MPGGPVGGNAIGTGQHSGREIDHARAMGAHIGALVVEEHVFEGEDAPLHVDRGAHLVPLLAGVVRCDEMLVPVLDPLDRTPQPERCEADQHVLGIKLAAHAEPATHVALEEMHGVE